MSNFLNIAAYEFVSLTELSALRSALKSQAMRLGLHGTIILSPEGINLMLSGWVEAIRKFQKILSQEPQLTHLIYKESFSATIAFKRLLVKIKPEIIAFGVPSVNPVKEKAPYVSPHQLKRWLDEQQDIVLLDTRNTYEIRLGAFEKTQHLDLRHFRDFPKAVAQLTDTLKQQIIVTYCTGGIRCEKAALYLQQQGFTQVYQLEGGILNYFATQGNANEHYRGECFVFDRRVGLNAELTETGTVQCFVCLMPVTLSEQQADNYLLGKYCPHCKPKL